MTAARLDILGGFALTDAEGQNCPIVGVKSRALLAVLALAPDGKLSRDRIMALLWSDRAAPQARDSLKHALADLRRTLEATAIDCLGQDRHSVWIESDALRVDAREFLAIETSADADVIKRNLDLFRGELLDGIDIRDNAFDDWLRQERQRFATLAENAMTRLLTSAEARGDLEAADDAATRLLALDPLREDAVRARMRIHAARGERSFALRLSAELRDRLHAELQAKPDPETVALEAEIRGGRMASGRTSQDLQLPDRPSIAVLPFRNLSGDPDQDYFSEGVAEDIITALSHYRWFFVIARNSSFVYRDRSAGMQEIARNLGVRYLLDGSVRRSGNMVRLTGELIEPKTGTQVWGGSFDGKLDDIFAIQNDLTRRVVGAIEPEIQRGESLRAMAKPATNLAAYDCHMRGVWHHNRQDRPENFLEAIAWQRRAAALDPSLARAYMILARAHYSLTLHGFSSDFDQDRHNLFDAASRAVALENRDAYSHYAMCLAYLSNGNPNGAVIEAERAIELAPNLALAQNALGWSRIFAGQFDTALDPITTAMRLNPLDPAMYFFYCCAALAQYHLGDYEAAARSAHRAHAANPHFFNNVIVLIACLGRLDRVGECAPLIAQLPSLKPAEAGKYWKYCFPYADVKHRQDLEEGFRLAGFAPKWIDIH